MPAAHKASVTKHWGARPAATQDPSARRFRLRRATKTRGGHQALPDPTHGYPSPRRCMLNQTCGVLPSSPAGTAHPHESHTTIRPSTHTLHGAAAASPTPYHIRYRALRSHRSATELFKRAPPRCAPVPCTFRDQHPGDAARPHRGQTASCPHRRRSEAHMKERPRAHAEARTRAHTHAWPLTSQACLHRPPWQVARMHHWMHT